MEQGGTEKQVLSLIDYFCHHHVVSLLAPIGSTSYQFEALGISYWQFVRWDFNFWRGIREVISHTRAIHHHHPIDLIHVHAAHELMAVVKLSVPNLPVVFTVHGYHGAGKNLSYWLSSQMANLYADRVIAVCEAEANLLKSYHLNPAKVKVIYNGVRCQPIDPDRGQELRDKFRILGEEIIIGTVARLTPDKGIAYLLKAVGLLREKYSNLHLIIAGTGKQATSLKQLADSLNLSSCVTFVGYLDRIQDLVSLFDIFVLPSLQEAFSLATLEAMALAKPIVATTVGGFKEQIQDGRTGLLVPPRSISCLATALEELITNPPKRLLLGKSAQAFYEQNFTIDRMLSQTASIYTELW